MRYLRLIFPIVLAGMRFRTRLALCALQASLSDRLKRPVQAPWKTLPVAFAASSAPMPGQALCALIVNRPFMPAPINQTAISRSIFCFALMACSTVALCAPWTYRGTLNDGGQPANGQYDLRLTLVNELATQAIHPAITVFNVPVKDGNFATEVDFGVDLTAAQPMRLKTEVAQGGSGFVALGEPTPFDAKSALAGICWDTSGNVVAAGEFLGATNNVAVEIKSNNRRVARFLSTASGAFPGDSAQVALGSSGNVASNIGATVSGGGGTIDGSGNLCLSCRNEASAQFSTVGGGFANTAATGGFATISGGIANTAIGVESTIGGGGSNSATNENATVSGGFSNQSSGLGSTVGGGNGNRAEGAYATVGGGADNCAGGDRSWAGGSNAKIRPGNQLNDGTCVANSGDSDGDQGTFIWADVQNPNFVSSGPNQFLVRAQGGMAINTNTPVAGASLTVAGNANVSGGLAFGSVTRQMLNLWGPDFYGIGVQTATLYQRSGSGFAWFEGGVHANNANDPGAGGTLRMSLSNTGQLRTTTGTIATLSDARLKRDVADYSGALARISALRPVRYAYRDSGQAFQAPGAHLGFIAQEVQKVFPEWVSTDENGYLMLSLRGFEAVAVGAIQELQAGTAVQVDALKKENAYLRARLDALEAKLDAGR